MARRYKVRTRIQEGMRACPQHCAQKWYMRVEFPPGESWEYRSNDAKPDFARWMTTRRSSSVLKALPRRPALHVNGRLASAVNKERVMKRRKAISRLLAG